jgi:outer membrane protein OmpA-like peptidoglycan-associated protein
MKRAIALVTLSCALPAFGQTGVVAAPGLITTSVIHDSMDYEALSVLNQLDARGMVRTVRWTREDAAATGGKRVESTRFITRPEDLEASHRIVIVHLDGDAENMPGAIQGVASRAMLREIRAQRSTAIILGAADANSWSAGLLGSLTAGRKYYRGTLARVEPSPVRRPVLLDGRRAELPAWHVKGAVSVGASAGTAELWILDDDELPLILRWDALGASVTLVRIDNPPRRDAKSGKSGGIDLGAALGAACHAEVSGLYFASGSAQLLPESRPALERMAALMREHADWVVVIEGHTDNLGSAEFNLGLSNDRAANVRNALVRSFAIPAARLAAKGYGLTRPVETNATLEGRARNRRVELSRQCH